MAQLRKLLLMTCGVVCMAWTAQATAEDPVKKPEEVKKKAPTAFLRVLRDSKNQPIALQTSTVRYVPTVGKNGITVDLIGVVHIGEKSYYEALNKQMEQYDAMLYELVAPEGTRIPKGGKRESDNPISMLQGMMKNLLDLESQLEHIDYTRENFVHADLSPEKMSEAMRERGETPFTLMMSVFSDMMRKSNQEQARREKAAAEAKAKNQPLAEPDVDLTSLFTDPNSGTKLKRLMAEQFETMGDDAALGPTLGTLLVSDRNKAAMKVLQREIARGKKKIAIFYGAAHMPDFEKRLREEFDLKKEKEEWLTAWDLKPKRGVQVPPLLKLFGGQP